MTRWVRGEVEIEAMLAAHELQQLDGSAANGSRLIARARMTLTSAESLAASDPDSAFVLTYDACRSALTAILVHQGLRPTTTGGHYAVERAVRAQFGQGFFRPFGDLRRRRHEIEYPRHSDGEALTGETAEAIAAVQTMVDAADTLIGRVGLF